jgi:hypothetical protein
LLCAASLQDQEGSGGTSWLHPRDIDGDPHAFQTRAHHGKTTIDVKSPGAVPDDLESK